MRLRLVAAATILAGSLYAADPELVSLAIPDAQMMAGVNVEQVMLSPLGQFLLAQADASFEKQMAAAGFSPRRDLREILVSFHANPSVGPSNGVGWGIALARGTFDLPKILEAAQAEGATVATYKGVSVVQRSKQDSLAFPDSTMAIMGNDTDVRAAIDRKTAPASISSALAVKVNELSTTEDVWFVSMAPLSELQPPAPGATNPLAMYGKVQQANGGVKFGANVVASVQLVSPTDQDATALAMVLKAAPGIAQMGDSKDEGAMVAALLQSLNVTADGPVTKISWSVPETQIEQMIRTANAAKRQPSKPADAPVHSRPMVRDRAATVERSVPSPAGAVPQRIRVGGNVQKAKLIQQPAPVYPPLAMQARISGVVRFSVIIGKDGTVENASVVSGHPLLVPSALDAVKQWVYQPTLLNGQPVEVVTQVEVNFSLEE